MSDGPPTGVGPVRTPWLLYLGLVPAIATPTRRLLGLPFMAALATGWPVQALHLLSGLSWLATGLLADRLARRLWPGAPLTAWLAGAVTLCATPDFFTDAPLAVGYQLSIVAYLGAALLGLRWLQNGSRLALGLAPLCLFASGLDQRRGRSGVAGDSSPLGRRSRHPPAEGARAWPARSSRPAAGRRHGSGRDSRTWAHSRCRHLAPTTAAPQG